MEPDPELARVLDQDAEIAKLHCDVVSGSVETLQDHQRFDAILYIDVLEHIDDDAEELRIATSHLNLNGTLIVVAPAHQFLYIAFDQAVGHVRRYSKKTLTEVGPCGLRMRD